MDKAAIILAGGVGKRMCSKTPKQFLKTSKDDFPILISTLKKFSSIKKITLVLPKDYVEYWKLLCKKHKFIQPHKIVEGGKNRFYSVKNGLKTVNNNCIVAIHDGVRPFVSKELIDKIYTQAKKTPEFGIVPYISLKDSIREIIDSNSSISRERNKFILIQTPQCFYAKNLKLAYSQKFRKEFTDDASVFEAFGKKIRIVEGEEHNIKITTKNDLS